MARQGISREQVYEAAAALRDEGIAPTVQAVRSRIGSGSFSTIGGHLADWKAENAAQGPADIPAMPDTVQAAFHQIWATAARSAQESVETQREALEAMRREMHRERAEMAAEIERLERVLEETNARVEDLETALRVERKTGKEQAEKIGALSIGNARLEEQVKTAQAQTTATESALQAANTERDRDQAAHERERQRLEKRLEQEKALLEQQQQELDSERKGRADALRQVSELQTANARLEERAGAAETRRAELKRQFDDLQVQFTEVAKGQPPGTATGRKTAPRQRQEP